MMSILLSSLVLTLLFLSSGNTRSVADTELFIRPEQVNESNPCSELESSRCLTLSEFACNVSNSQSSIVLNFLPGKHHLASELSIIGIHQLKLASTSSSRAYIICEQSGKFKFKDINFVIVSNIEFKGCGQNEADSVRNFKIVNSSFVGTVVNGTFVIARNSKMTIVKCSFISNITGSIETPAYRQGSNRIVNAAYTRGALIATNESVIVIIKSLFRGSGGQFGRVIYAERSSWINITRSRVKNITSVSGPAVYAIGGCTITLNKTIISNNRAIDRGGGIFLYNSSLVARKCMFTNNSASSGGFLFSYMSVINMTDCHISNNTADYLQSEQMTVGGHGSHTENSYGNTNVSFRGYGGAMHIERTKLFIEKTRFFNNNASKSGGVIQAYHSPKVVFYNCTVNGNSAGQYGGAVASMGSSVYITKTFISGNDAETGGAFFNVGRAFQAKTANDTDTSCLIVEECIF